MTYSKEFIENNSQIPRKFTNLAKVFLNDNNFCRYMVKEYAKKNFTKNEFFTDS